MNKYSKAVLWFGVMWSTMAAAVTNPLTITHVQPLPALTLLASPNYVQYNVVNNLPFAIIDLEVDAQGSQGGTLSDTTNTCGANLPSGANCTFTTYFTATSANNNNALTLNFRFAKRVISDTQVTDSSSSNRLINAWGDNSSSQLGNGGIANSAVPVTALSSFSQPALANITQGAAGASHTCALMADKTVKCWGYNGEGELGNNSTTNSPLPVVVSGIDGTTAATQAVALTAGTYHTCALMADKTVKCWGENAYGELGNNSTTNSAVPVVVSGIEGTTAATQAVAVTAGAFHTCAVMADKTVKCWGRNAYGQLGDGSTTNSSVPVVVSGIEGTTAATQAVVVIAGGYHTCALMADNTVKCWGRNAYGQLGDGSTTDSPVPVVVSSIDGTTPATQAVALTAGGFHTCAVMADKTVKCWGRNAYGQLGNNSTINSSVTVVVSGIDGATAATQAVAVSAGVEHTCALMADKTVKCWGRNNSGQLGNNSTTNSSVPVVVSGIEGTTAATQAVALTAGAYHTCSLMADNTVKCWGGNAYGELGNDSTTNSSVPVVVWNFIPGPALTNITQGAAGASHTCAVMADKTVKCWGLNANGQLGNNSTTDSPVPVGVSDIDSTTPATQAVALTAGNFHTCALMADKTVKCWGRNVYGQLGDGSTTDSPVPVVVSGIDGTTTATQAVALTAGASHTCAVMADNTVKCWGYNGDGELGNGNTTNSPVPVVVSGIDGTTAATQAMVVIAGGYHTCALMADNTVKCWGLNAYGQLGNNSTTNSSVPVLVSGIDGATAATQAVALTAGLYHTCAVMADNKVKCWGGNYHGQLGNNSTTDSHVPVGVDGIDGSTAANQAVALTAGEGHSCALMADNTVKCWGYNYAGQLGNGSTTDSPVPVLTLGIGGAGQPKAIGFMQKGLNFTAIIVAQN